MTHDQAVRLISETFENPFNPALFREFIKNLLNRLEESTLTIPPSQLPASFQPYVKTLERIGFYQEPFNSRLDVLVVQLQKETSLYHARAMQRNLIGYYLNQRIGGYPADAALVAFVPPESDTWRFSLVKLAYRLDTTPSGRVAAKPELTPTKRFSYLVGKDEGSHTAQSRLLPILEDDATDPTLQRIEDAFSVEAVTEEFFDGYQDVFETLQKLLMEQTEDKVWAHDYALQLLNRLMFLYFIQKKRWLGNNPNFIRTFWQAYQNSNQPKDTFFSDWLSILFFEAFNQSFQAGRQDRKHLPEEIRTALATAPYLNGGLFSRNKLDEKYDPIVPDSFFALLFDSFQGTQPGFLERHNFTITESSPLDVEVAVDPEMIGIVYEQLVNITSEGITKEDQRGKAGIFYTPRVEIDLMCRLALVDWLANHLGENHKPLLYRAVFAYDQPDKESADNEIARLNLWHKLNDLLRSVTVCDPACGSGSFLVGMLLVLDDLIARANYQLGIEETPYQRRRKIIGSSLYGVDVMEWAVHIAELRLWLQLVVETELKPAERALVPLLPNLNFKLRQGDSLLQEIGGINFNLHRTHLDLPPYLKGKITQLKGKKLRYFYGETKGLSEELLKEEEKQLFQDALFHKRHALSEEIKTLTCKIESLYDQLTLADTGKPKELNLLIAQWQAEKEKKEAELERVEQALNTIRTVKDIPFVWDIAFVEVFEGEKEGFDIVIGNPPYVRQEMIAPPLLPEDEYSKDDWRELKKMHKEKLRLSVISAWPDFFKGRQPDAKSDLYIYFYFHGLSLLNPKGSFCFITSNSWLDVGYGKDLQEFLLRQSNVKMIIDNETKRTFARADVNTVIVLLAAPEERRDAGLDKIARFVMFKVPFEQVLSPVIFEEIEEAKERAITKEYRVTPIRQRTLWENGIEEPEPDETKRGSSAPLIKSARYIGDKWGGKYLRAPDIYFKILEKGKGKLVRLGDIAEVRAGIITGNNIKYYKIRTATYDTNKYSLVFRSPREVNKILLTKDDAISIIQVTNVPYEIRKAPLLWVDLRGDKHICHFNKDTLPFEHNFYGILAKKNFNNESLCLLLNSTLTCFFVEVIGRKGLGGGAIRLVKIDLLQLPCISLSTAKLEEHWEFVSRPIQSIFTELGFDPDKPIREQEPKPLPDRKALDEVVFDALGLTEEERKEVYWAVAELVHARLTKAKSV
ncbi:MAG: DNA methyltransferase [candidate division WOR-3 bacterium]